MSELKSHFQAKTHAMTGRLLDLVQIESPSHDKAAVDQMGRRVSQWMQEAGGSVEHFYREQAGEPVLGRWPGKAGERPILLLCHMDTVWPLGTLAERPARLEGDRFYGPGAYDMQAGIVAALTAIQGLRELGIQPAAPIMLLCTGDEEIGSHHSRALIEELAAESRLVLCLEPCMPGGLIKTARKGVGIVKIIARGRSVHAGADHQLGINAIEEMAHQVIKLQALTNYSLGTTVSVGVIQGGTASNVVPDSCQARVDFRVTGPDEATRILQAIWELQPHLDGARLEIEGGLNRPPMVRDALMVRTFEQARQIVGQHGIDLQEGFSGGGSDANFTAALGVPTLDGLGPGGDGAHAVNEAVEIDSLAVQTTILAALLSEWV